MDLPVINHEDYFAKIGDDHKFPINKFGELAKYLIKQKIVNRELIKVDDKTILDSEMIASQIAITKAIKDYDLNRVITFHSTIKNAI